LTFAETAIVASKPQINPKKIVGQDMKRRINRPGEALALILVSTLCVSTPCLAAQGSDNPRQQEQQQQTPGQQPAQQPGQQPSAQQPGQQPSAQQPGQQPSAQEPGQPQAQQANQTFAGKIIKLTNGQFALLTGQSPEGKATGHFLDDQQDAQKYEGKQVTVTGTFDTASNTIHVTNIQAG
jgi:hypothetical protein